MDALDCQVSRVLSARRFLCEGPRRPAGVDRWGQCPALGHRTRCHPTCIVP